MISQSTLGAGEKAKVKNTIGTGSNKIYYAALARIYYAYPQPDKWSYAGLQGALTVMLEQSTNTYHFKMVDLDGTRGIIWDHELYEGLELNQDRNFFLSFAGDKCMIGFVFPDESEAKTFYKKWTKAKKDSKPGKARTEKKKSPSKGGKIDKSMISGPQSGSFKHVAHVGYDPDSGYTSKGVDPSWTALVNNLEGAVGKDIVEREMEYIKNYVREQQEADAPKKSKPPAPPAPARRHVANGSASSQGSNHHAPPPPPPPRSQNGNGHAPSPPPRPPPPSRPQLPPRAPASINPPEEVTTPTPPPPPPRRTAPTSSQPPPPPPTRSSQVAPPPPPPPSNQPSRPPNPPEEVSTHAVAQKGEPDISTSTAGSQEELLTVEGRSINQRLSIYVHRRVGGVLECNPSSLEQMHKLIEEWKEKGNADTESQDGRYVGEFDDTWGDPTTNGNINRAVIEDGSDDLDKHWLLDGRDLEYHPNLLAISNNLIGTEFSKSSDDYVDALEDNWSADAKDENETGDAQRN